MKDHDDDDDDRELGESIHEACTNMMTKWNKYFSLSIMLLRISIMLLQII
jgi:hypothetical protein